MHDTTASLSEDDDEEDKHPEVNANKEGEAAAVNDEEAECADEMTNVVRPMDWEVKIRLRRDVVHQVAALSPTHGPTGSCERFDQHPGHEHQVEKQDDKLKVRGLTFSVPSEIKAKNREGKADLRRDVVHQVAV